LFADDGRFGGQVAEDSDHRVRRGGQLDLLQGDDGGLHQVLRLGNVASHHQVYSIRNCSGNGSSLLFWLPLFLFNLPD